MTQEGWNMNAITKIIRRIVHKPIAVNVNRSSYGRYCLISYIRAPFQSRKRKDTHQNIWQVVEIARIIGTFGYDVDVIQYDETDSRIFRHAYDLLFEIQPKNTPGGGYWTFLNPGCIRIAYLTGSSPAFSNEAERKRLEDYTLRHGENVLCCKRQAQELSKETEKFDAFFLIGNEQVLHTYDEFHLPDTYLIPNTGYDFGDRFVQAERKKQDFLFFSGFGLIHKGLDLVLDVFAEEGFPCELYVCGPTEQEKDVQKELGSLLYQRSNIHTAGFVDIWSREFAGIAGRCAFSILPSCSEAMAGSVLTAMSAGIIPVCSRECGFDEDDVMILKDCRIETIREAVLQCAAMPDGEIQKRRQHVRNLIKTKYSREQFTDKISRSIDSVLERNRL